MSIDIKKYKNEVLFAPLGGAGEIGMNLNLYIYKGKILLVDMGAGFADDYYPGIDQIIPDIEFLKQNISNIVGLVLTHAHEDHVGAIQYLWPELKCDIYATKFTKRFIQNKFVQLFDKQNKKFIKEIEENSQINVGPFAIETCPITHSTPEMQALFIRTEIGNILHTGDWKFDHNPLIGQPTDLNKLKKFGDEGVLAITGDSTNVFNETPSGSEGDLKESLIDIIALAKGMVVVTTFASNVARIETIMEAAKICNKKVAIAGRGIWRIIETAQASGYLLDIPDIVNEDAIKNIPRNELLVIATGCQGEPLAAMCRSVANTHPFLRFMKGDTVIFSSKIIPGNEKKIYRLFNNLVRIGVNLMTEKEHFVHVSGHPSAKELRQMYELVKPKMVIPVHGELLHIHEHARIAKEVGVSETIEPSNGSVFKITNGAEYIGSISTGYMAIDGKSLISTESHILKTRRKLQKEGIIFVVLLVNDSGRLLDSPVIKAPGVLDNKLDQEIFDSLEVEVNFVIDQHCISKGDNFIVQDDTLVNITRQAIRRILRQTINKNPSIEISILKS